MTPRPVAQTINELESAAHANIRRHAERWCVDRASSTHRWALLAAIACDSPGDLRTLRAWARHSGVSYSSLRECCRLAGLKPHGAHAFVRVLRTILHSRVSGGPAEVLLEVRDRRTLDRLLHRAGLADKDRIEVSFGDFVRGQRFVNHDHPALVALATLLGVLSEDPTAPPWLHAFFKESRNVVTRRT